MEEQKNLNYAEELAKLETKHNERKNTTYWKPTPGHHVIRILKEPTNTEYVDSMGKAYAQWLLSIYYEKGPDVPEGEKWWTIPKSDSIVSIRHQLVKIGALKGKLAGERISIFVQGRGKERRYTIPEAL